jgi:hypothetical protein
VPAARDKYIRRFDVAMDDSFRMGSIESIGEFDRQRQQDFGFKRASRDTVRQRHAFQKFHGDEHLVAMFADFVDGANVRMVQRGSGSRLAAKSFQGLRILRQRIRQEFQRHEAAEFSILSLVDNSHTAAAKLFQNAVVRDDLIDHSKMSGFCVASS